LGLDAKNLLPFNSTTNKTSPKKEKWAHKHKMWIK
jgi:hypothetical protein